MPNAGYIWHQRSALLLLFPRTGAAYCSWAEKNSYYQNMAKQSYAAVFSILQNLTWIDCYNWVTRWIVLPLLISMLYEFGSFKGIFQKATLAMLLFYWFALTQFCTISNDCHKFQPVVFGFNREWKSPCGYDRSIPNTMQDNESQNLQIHDYLRTAWCLPDVYMQGMC